MRRKGEAEKSLMNREQDEAGSARTGVRAERCWRVPRSSRAEAERAGGPGSSGNVDWPGRKGCDSPLPAYTFPSFLLDKEKGVFRATSHAAPRLVSIGRRMSLSWWGISLA